MAYQPKPIDTSHVKLAPEILAVTELLAKNTHEIWARWRENQERQPGDERDAAGEKHPGFVPYEQLPESERDVDREVSMEVLKVMLHLGFKIERDEGGTTDE